MPTSISTSYASGSSYEVVNKTPDPKPQQAQTPAQTEEITDTVEITITEPPADNQPAPNPAGTYTRPVTDRFRFEIANGMFDSNKRFSALNTRFESGATATHSARESLETQIARTPAGDNLSSALFQLQHKAAQPNPSEAGSSTEAVNELNRMTDQGLDLLKNL